MSVRIDNSVQGPITLRKTDNSVCDIDDRGLTGLRSRSHGINFISSKFDKGKHKYIAQYLTTIHFKYKLGPFVLHT
jgi:hypothetical protein